MRYAALALALLASPAAAQDRADMADMLGAWFASTSTDEILSDMERHFAILDVDGVPGLGEADRLKFFGDRVASMREKALGRLERNDLDGDGRATRDEIVAVAHDDYGFAPGAPEAADHRGVRKLVELALRADLDGDGTVTREEMLEREQVAIDAFLAERTLLFDGLTTGLDISGDGIVQVEEVRAGFAELSRDMDANGDGKLTMRERDTYLARRR